MHRVPQPQTEPRSSGTRAAGPERAPTEHREEGEAIHQFLPALLSSPHVSAVTLEPGPSERALFLPSVWHRVMLSLV